MGWNEMESRRRIQKKRNGTNTNHNNINNDRLRLRLRLDDDYDVCHFYCITLRPPLHFGIHSFQFQTSTFYLLPSTINHINWSLHHITSYSHHFFFQSKQSLVVGHSPYQFLFLVPNKLSSLSHTQN